MRRALFILLFLAAPVSADDLRTLGGKTVTGKTTRITGEDLTLHTDAGFVTLPLSQCLALDLKDQTLPGSGPVTLIKLLDDSVLRAKAIAFSKDRLDVTLSTGAKVGIPWPQVISLLRGAEDPGLTKKFTQALTASKVKRDRIFILRDGELNPLEGTLGQVDDKTIQFTREGAAAVAVGVEKVQGLVFYRTDPLTETLLCKVIDNQGNSIAAKSLLMDGPNLEIATSFGAQLSFPWATVNRLDFNLDKLTYLSDLEPSKVVEKSSLGLYIASIRKDRNLDGEPILLDRPYSKGLAVHAHTELEFDLAGKYKDFKATLGVDGRGGAVSSCQVTIYLDGVRRFSETLSPKMSRPLALDVKDVSTLRIVVGYAEPSEAFQAINPHAIFADARVGQ